MVERGFPRISARGYIIIWGGGAVVAPTLVGYKWEVGGGGGCDVVGGGTVKSGAERSAVADWALSPFSLVLLSCLAAKSEKWQFCERGCEGKVNSEEVESKWLKGGSLA